MIIVQNEYKDDILLKSSANYIKELECYEVELIHNESGHDTTYRIEFIDNNYIDVSINELRALKLS